MHSRESLIEARCWSFKHFFASQQILEQAFGTFVPLLFAVWARARGTQDAPAAAALVLEALALLHFACDRHGLHADLVQVS